MTPTAYVYLRKSTKDYDDERAALPRQQAACEELAARLGAKIVRVFADDDVSAATSRRAGTAWAEMLAALPVDRPTYLLAWKDDRLDRNLTEYEMLERASRAHGFRVVTADGEIDWDSAATPVMAALRKAEALKTRVRTRAALDGRRSRGLMAVPGRRLFGFTSGDNPVPIPREVAEIKWAVDAILSGRSQSAVVREWNARGVRTTMGGEWTQRSLRKLLTNPRLIGHRTYQGEDLGPSPHYPAILPKRKWDRLQLVLKEAAGDKSAPKRRSLLGGIVRCGVCESRMVATQNNGVLQYRCEKRHCVARSRKLIDEYVTRAVLARAVDERVAEQWDALEAEAEKAATQATEAMLEISALRDRYRAREISAEDYYATLDVLRNREEEFNRLYLRAVTRQAALADQGAARREWNEWSLDRRRQFIAARVAAIVVHKRRYTGSAARVLHDDELTLEWRR